MRNDWRILCECVVIFSNLNSPPHLCSNPQMQIKTYSPQEAKAFAEKWLPAWTGNNPELLASFYTEDAFYSDPVIPRGVQVSQSGVF